MHGEFVDCQTLSLNDFKLEVFEESIWEMLGAVVDGEEVFQCLTDTLR